MVPCISNQNVPAPQVSPRQERDVPYDVDRGIVQAYYNTFRTQWNTPRVLYHSHPITQSKLLILQFVYSMRGLQHRLPWDALHHGFLDRRRRFVGIEAVRELFNFSHRCLI